MRIRRKIVRRLPLLLLSISVSCGGGTRGGSSAGSIEGLTDLYAQRVQPIIDQSCNCHTPGNPTGGFVVKGASYASLMGQGLVVPGDPTKSTLLTSMRGAGSWNQYYFDPADVDFLRDWISSGAPRYGKDPGKGPGIASGPRVVGLKACAVCHAGNPNAPVYRWLSGAHANLEAIGPDHKPLDLGLESNGFPYYGFEGLGGAGTTPPDGSGEEEAGCSARCHDQLGDGHDLTRGVTGNVPRPVVGCESCHGGGSLHYGSGPIPFPRPNAGRCGPCHNQAFDHNEYHPEADNILEDYLASPHARSINEHNYVQGSEKVKATCAKCHTDQGAKLYKRVSGGHDGLAEALGGQNSVSEPGPIQCRTCHDPHCPGELLLPGETEGSVVRQSSEYRTCTSCHQTQDGYHGENNSHSWSGNAVGTGAFDPGGVIYDTHFDDPATALIEGYILDPSDARACRNCHNVHSADATINRQWARSAHGGRIALAKEAALSSGPAGVFAAGVTDEYGAAWAHYDFKGADRRTCQRCHTTTGFVGFIQDPQGYDPEKSVFFAAGQQKELLYCHGCHSANSGPVRNPGAVTVAYASSSFAFPDVARSNVCVPCHAGSVSGKDIAASTADFGDLAFMNSHYLAASAILFRATGYEFQDRDYSDVADFKHSVAGSDQGGGTGTEGPCVGCHMSGPEGHLCETFEKSEGGTILAFLTPACAECHKTTESGDYSLTPEGVDEEARGFEAALEALEAQLAIRGYHYYPSYPYIMDASELDPTGPTFRTRGVKNWLADGNGDGVVDKADPADVATGKPNMGAAFNLNLLRHEPGAYAHNRFYAKRLIYDSIDWLDDHHLNDSVLATLAALGNSAGYEARATEYLSDVGR